MLAPIIHKKLPIELKKITHETTIVKNKHFTNSVKLEEIEILEVEKNISEVSFQFCCN